jgi:cbb3-type cytochrome oxidase subunit 3
MYKHLLDRISGDIDWMALFSLVTFFLVFAMVVYVAMAERKAHVDYMAGLPLRNDAEQDESQS